MKAHARRCEACGAFFNIVEAPGDSHKASRWRCAECNARPKPATDTVGGGLRVQRNVPERALAEMARGGRR